MRAAALRAGARLSGWRRASAALALLAGAGAVPAAGQRPDLPLRDSLAAVSDAVALGALERQMIAWAREHRDDPGIHLHLGALALRLGELQGQPHWDEAIAEFEWAAELAPGSPLPWYGLGLAWMGSAPALYDVRTTMQAVLRRDPVTKAGAAFRAALERDPGFTPAAVAWGRLALLPALRDEADPALAALRALGGGDSATALVRGRLERRAGEPDSALAAFGRYAGAGGDPALARLERARVLLAAGRPGGAEAYYDGVGRAGPAVVAGYRADLAVIADSAELAGFDAAPGPARRAWLERFWQARDLAGFRADGERLAEHYRRLEEAQGRFGLAPFKRRFGFEEYYQSGRTDLDDRGVIWVRHGAPTERNRSVRFQAESWYYAPGTEPELKFHFVATADLDDYRLVPSPAQVGAEAREELRDQGGPAAAEYWKLSAVGSAGRPQLVQELFAAGRAMMRRGTTTDSWARRWEGDLPAGAQAVAVGLPGADGRVHLAVAVPLAALPSTGETRRLRLRLAAWAPDGSPVDRFDSLLTIEGGSGPRGDRATGLVRASFRAPAGPLHLQVMAETDSAAGTLVLRELLEVPDADAGLGLSDLVLGRESLGLSWSAGDGEPVPLNPLGGFPRGEPLALYYEVYGLADGLATADLVLWRAEPGDTAGPRDGDRRALRLRFEERGAGRVTRVRRTVDLAGLAPGDYRLRLAVRDGAGAEAARSARLRVTRE